MPKNIVIATLAAIVAVLGAIAFVSAQRASDSIGIDIRVWRSPSDHTEVYVSARAEGGSWGDLGTLPVDFDQVSQGMWEYSDFALKAPLASTGSAAALAATRYDGYVEGHQVGYDRGYKQGKLDAGGVRFGMGGKTLCVAWRGRSEGISPWPYAGGLDYAVRHARAATVKVCSSTDCGTAFHVGSGHFVTNAHVVRGFNDVSYWHASTLTGAPGWKGNGPDRRTFSLTGASWSGTARALSYSHPDTADYAILSAHGLPDGFPYLEPAYSVRVGDPVATVGYPGGVRSEARGIITTESASLAGWSIEYDAGQGEGASGSPVVNGCGRVVGLHWGMNEAMSHGNAVVLPHRLWIVDTGH